MSEQLQVNYDNSYDGIGGTGYNVAAEKNDSATVIIDMSPEKFLSLTPSRMGYTDVSFIEQAIKEGRGIAMPFLEVKVADADKKQLEVTGHEGRHRCLAMKNLGITKGKVILVCNDFYRNPQLHIKENILDWELLPDPRCISHTQYESYLKTISDNILQEDWKKFARNAALTGGLLAAGHNINPNYLQNIPVVNQFVQATHIGDVVKAETNPSQKQITYIDKNGNKLVKTGGDLSQLCNNPGNFLYKRKAFGPKNWKKLQDMGAIAYFIYDNVVYAVFPSMDAGYKAIEMWWTNPMRSEWTIDKAMHIYAPSIENDTKNYLNYFKQHKLDINKQLKDLSNHEIKLIISLIRNMEGSKQSQEQFIPA